MKIAKNNLVLLSILLGLYLIIPFQICLSAENDELNIIFILDASGSMTKEIEGGSKIEIAKRVLTSLIDELPEGVNVGLETYGHKGGESCKVEMIVPIGPLNRDLLKARISSIVPQGRTPITLSLQEAVKQLKPLEGKNSIILISDGQETCAGDPCSAVEDLKEAGIEFEIHVIGFDVVELERRQLRCIAKAGGGKYYSADTADQLELVTKEAAQEAIEVKSERKRIKIGGPGTLAWKPASWINLWYWTIYKADTGEKIQSGNNWQPQVLPMGDYIVAIRQNNTDLEVKPLLKEITIESGKTTEVVLNTGLKWANTDWVDLWYYVVTSQETGEKIQSATSWETQLLPPGRYIISIRQESTELEAPVAEVDIGEGDVTEISLETGISWRNTDWVNLWYWAIYDAEGEEKVQSGTTLSPQALADGEYMIYTRQNNTDREVPIARIELKEGEIEEIWFDTGLTWSVADWADVWYWAIYDAESGEKIQAVTTRDAQLLPTGKYKITIRQNNTDKEVQIAEVEIKTGEIIDLALDTGLSWSPADWIDLWYWAVYDAESGEKIQAVTTWDPQALPPGKYRITIRQNNTDREVDILGEDLTISPGDKVNVVLNTGVILIPSEEHKDNLWYWAIYKAGTDEKVQSITSWDAQVLAEGKYKITIRFNNTDQETTLIDDLEVEKGVVVELEL